MTCTIPKVKVEEPEPISEEASAEGAETSEGSGDSKPEGGDSEAKSD